MITLQTGAAGPEVQVLQTWLAALNPNPAAFCSAEPASTLPMSFASANGSSVSTLAVTGVFDQDTAAAVTRFQCDNGVPTGLLGNVDYLTWWQLAQSARKQYFGVDKLQSTPRWLAELCSPMIPPPRGLSASRFIEGYAELFGAPGKASDGLNKLLTFIAGDSSVTDIRWAAYMFATVHRECGPGHSMLPVAEDGCSDDSRPVCTVLSDGKTRSYGDPVYCPPVKTMISYVTPPAQVSPMLERLGMAVPPKPPYAAGHGANEKWKPPMPKCPAGKAFHTYYGRGYVQLTFLENYEKMSKITGVDLVHYPEKALETGTAYKIMSHGMRNGFFTGAKLSGFINGSKCNYHDARTIINGHDAASQIEDWAKRYEIILYHSFGS